MSEINTLKTQIENDINGADSLEILESLRVATLGKKGSVSALMKTLGKMSPEERKEQGPLLNALKNDVAGMIEIAAIKLKDAALKARLDDETLDISLEASRNPVGAIHPISQTMEELVSIFGAMGFKVAEGPDIEDDWHNFTALNFPPGHPAREMQDTFFLPNDENETDPERARKLLRTHTSSVQIRNMQNSEPPIKTICFGRTYRSDWDMTHTPMFHQMECLCIDEIGKVTMAHLKGCLEDFVRTFFKIENLPVRFRPSFFPFVEPGAEVDIGYYKSGKGIKLGKAPEGEEQKWMEILGSGMVHPNVLKNCGIDPEKYQGFAFGMGLERATMLKYGIPDLRTFFDSDVRWLGHYGFTPFDRPNSATGT